MSLKVLDCQVSEMINSDACPRPTTGVRRYFSMTGSVIQTVSLVWFALAKSPARAGMAYTLMKTGQCLHSSGFTANYMEVGNEDAAVLSAVGNTLATTPGFYLPILGAFCMNSYGSYTGWFLCLGSPGHLSALGISHSK